MAVVVPTTVERRLLCRFTHGITRADVDDLRRLGSAQRWFEWQLRPAAIPDDAADEVLDWHPLLTRDPGRLWAQYLSGAVTAAQAGDELVGWTLLRRLRSRRQVLESMTAFWSDVLHVPVPDSKSWPLRFRYDAMLRERALGRFDDLLAAAVLHPAMLCYLDNARSTARLLNENLGRELLELHTVGAASGYGEQDVLASARLLTGYRVDVDTTWQAYYSPQDHHVGPLRVLDFDTANGSREGQPVTLSYLRHLAHHPATADRVARRLCTRFVSDDPPPELVSHVAHAFTASGTDIKQTLRALIAHPLFAATDAVKARTPVEDALATLRLLRVRVLRPVAARDLALSLSDHTAMMGQRPFDWPRPDGPPDTGPAWTSAGRMLRSWMFHYSCSNRRGIVDGARYPGTSSWLPPLPASLDEVIDHVCRVLLARPASDHLRKLVATRVGLSRRTRIRRVEDLGDWRTTSLLNALLDTPEHMSR